jgi:hypothetical protein
VRRIGLLTCLGPLRLFRINRLRFDVTPAYTNISFRYVANPRSVIEIPVQGVEAATGFLVQERFVAGRENAKDLESPLAFLPRGVGGPSGMIPKRQAPV